MKKLSYLPIYHSIYDRKLMNFILRTINFIIYRFFVLMFFVSQFIYCDEISFLKS